MNDLQRVIQGLLTQRGGGNMPPIMKRGPDRITIHPMPDVVFLYPTAVTAIVCWILSYFFTSDAFLGRMGLIFTLIFFSNLSILAFDFNRFKTVALILSVVILILLGILFNVFGAVFTWISHIQIIMKPSFYMAWSLFFDLLYILVFINTRFNYWEVSNNELVHHHGFLGDVKRWPAPNMGMSKEIKDVFEFLLLLSGRVIFQPQGEKTAIVLDNVFRVNHVEVRLKSLLGVMAVDNVDTTPDQA
jgi:hypothetical protein